MEERVICKNCTASILRETANRTGGVCKPCYHFNIRSTIGETPFGRAFDLCNKLHRFYTKGDYKQELNYIWIYLVSDVLSMLGNIRCGYHDKVFLDCKSMNGTRFKLRDAEHFREWCLARLELARSKTNELNAETVEEQTDRTTLLQKVDLMQTTVELAYEILRNREIYI